MESFPLSLRLLLLPVLLGINGFFAAAELALVSVRETRMRQLAQEGSSRARAVLGLLENPDRLLSASQLGVTLASLGLGWAGQETVYHLLAGLLPPITNIHTDRLLHFAAFAVAFLIITFLHMVIGEVVPKNLAFERAERLALAAAPALELFARATHFFVHTVEAWSAALSRLLGLQGAPKASAHSIEELKLIVSASRRHGLLPASQEDLLHRVIDFYDVTAREVMVPRSQMVSLPADSSLESAIRVIRIHRHSRLPVWEGSPEHIIGILYAKDLWALLLRRPPRQFRLRDWLHPHRVVPETKPLHQLLAEFQQHRFHMAMVVDEFGTIAGLVTVEDVVEQIVGEIRDEHDLPAPARAGLAGRPG
ncbi:MAG TPA: hemolysin family protein, partial [Bryobacterales bacterium]|nr:hemolysin family protein [Bryobacterales bacterium]